MFWGKSGGRGGERVETNTYEIPGLPVVLRRKAEGQVWTARIKRPGGGSDFGRIERTTGCRDLVAAIGAAHKIYSDALTSKSRIARRSKTLTFGEVAAEFLEREKLDVAADLIKPARYNRARAALIRHFIPALGHHFIADIDKSDIHDFIIKRRVNLHLNADPDEIVYERKGKELRYRRAPPRASDETLRRERTVFNAVMNFAESRGYIAAAPAYAKIKNLGGKKRRPFFSPEAMILLQETSIARILATRHALHRRQRLMCHLRMMWIYLSGMRPQEVALVQLKDVEAEIDRDGKQTFVIDLRNADRLKNEKHRREVVALPQLSSFLARTMFPGCGYQPEDFFFADTRRNPLGPSNRIFRELLVEAVKNQVSWEVRLPDESSPYYSLRHTFITERLYEGWDIGAVARHCGTSAEMIERYYSHVKSRVERTKTRAPGPYIVPLPSEIWNARRGDKKPTIIDFEPDFRFPAPEENRTPDEFRRLERLVEAVE